jgi:hypothetical protein
MKTFSNVNFRRGRKKVLFILRLFLIRDISLTIKEVIK